MLSLKLEDDELQQLWQEKLRESLKYRMDQVNFCWFLSSVLNVLEDFGIKVNYVVFFYTLGYKKSPNPINSDWEIWILYLRQAFIN